MIPNPTRPNLPTYEHQVDLYWETQDAIALHLHLANAKWRGSKKVDQDDVMLLQHVKEKVAADKAVMITNSEFTKGPVAAARDDGIALHIVRPEFNVGELCPSDAATMQTQFFRFSVSVSRPIYTNEVVHRAFDLEKVEIAVIRPTPSPAPTGIIRTIRPYSPQTMPGYENRSFTWITKIRNDRRRRTGRRAWTEPGGKPRRLSYSTRRQFKIPEKVKNTASAGTSGNCSRLRSL